MTLREQQEPSSPLAGPAIVPAFERELNQLVALAKRGHRPTSLFFNPPNEWLISQMPILQELPRAEQERLLTEAEQVNQEAAEANTAGRAATRAWPSVVVRLDTGGLAFFSQLGVVRPA